MDTLLKRLEESPRLAQYVDHARKVLADEKRKRQRFYRWLTPSVKAEFINGEVVVHSPAEIRHTHVSRLIVNLIGNYSDEHGLGFVGYEKVLISLSRNDYEPDVVFYGKDKASRLTPDQLQCPAPDFIVEILSPSTRRHDRGIKFIDYAAHGVGEYWIVDPVKEALEQYVLSGKEYEPKLKADSGKVHSTAIPGFVIPVRAMFDVAENRKALRSILSR